MNIVEELNYRGLIKDYSNQEAVEKLLSSPTTIYCGFDPSASSLHMGNFVMISLLMRLQRAGHRIIAVVGGATGMIGDPSGKSAERNLQTKEALAENTRKIREQLERFIDLSDPKKGILVNNYDWLGSISMLDFLRDYGKFFSINYLLAKDIIANRLESGLSFTEFTYNILQAVDFLHLYRTEGCHLQVGGSDQWGNLTSGLELIRKTEGSDAEAEAMTCHLLLRSDGKKFGKSEKGALFLNADLTSPYQLYQYFYNVPDADAVKYMKVLTFLTPEEINKVEIEHLANPGARIGQKTLAYAVVSTVHGQDKADEAKMMSEVLFKGDISSLNKKQIEEIFGDLTVEVEGDLMLEDLLIKVGAASSKREAREFARGNSVLVNGNKETDPNKIISKADSLFETYTVLRRGKKNYYLVKHV